MLIICNQMHKVRQINRMEDVRLPQLLFYGELQCGKCLRNKPEKHLKNSMKNSIRATSVDV